MNNESQYDKRMKKVLILSFHFLPMNAIASQRALGYANHLKKFGYEPTILTFDWGKKDEEQLCSKEEFYTRINIEDHDAYRVIRIPVIKNSFLWNLETKGGSLMYKVWIIWCWFTGKLDVRPFNEVFARSERYYLNNYVKSNDYDLVAGIFSPHFHLKNAYLLHKKTGIPYVLDYRDLWDNMIVATDYSPSILLRIRDWCIKHYWRKYGQKAAYQTTIGEVWVDKLSEVTGNPNVASVFNGFQNEVYTKSETDTDDSFFKISYTGTLYDYQAYKMMIDGVALFLSRCSEEDLARISVSFVGTIKIGDFTVVLNYIKSKLNKYNVKLMSRVSKEESISLQRKSNVLIFATSPKVKGFYSGKIFEYISSGSMILMGPQDFKGAADLIKLTNTGSIYNSEEEMSKLLVDLFQRWKSGEVIRPINVNKDKIEYYSRENQTKQFSRVLDKSLME